MHILEKIESLKGKLHAAKTTSASDEVVALLTERITELEEKVGCFCASSGSKTPDQIKDEFDELRATAILANARVKRCPLHGPVIAQREQEEQIP